jgi:hypothetical protein
LTNKTLTGAVMNGTVGATTPSTGAFTTLSSSGLATLLSSQITGATFPSSGSGLELVFQSGTSKLQSFNRTGSAYLPLTIDGTTVGVLSSGATIGAFTSTGLAVTGLTDISAASSGQIKFPATQNASADANTLDDYEEGTWTPSVGGTATYGAQTGYYVKVGKIVYVKGTIITTLIGTGSTNTISGLPFTCRVTTPLSVAYFDTINTAATFLGIRISQANTTMLLVGTTAAQATITDSFSTFKNGTYLEFAGVYEVA